MRESRDDAPVGFRLFLNSANCVMCVFDPFQTILKVNAAFVFFLLMTTFVAVHNVQAYYTWYVDRETCLSGIWLSLEAIGIIFVIIFFL